MLKEGSKAPAFKGINEAGETISLSTYKGKKLVLYFYPKDMTPGCTIEAKDFSKLYKKYQSKGIEVLGVSKDSVARHVKFKEKCDLAIPLLADEDGEVCKAFGVWRMKKFMGRQFMGIVRTTFVINEKGLIEKIYDEVKVKDHAKSVLEAIS